MKIHKTFLELTVQNSDAASCTAQHKQKNNMKQQKSIHIKMLLKKKKKLAYVFFLCFKTSTSVA